ncbi:MAG: nitronate monooxygenase family protein [Spirochaetota bacterium]|nr:nitronate monooxygenase family protein [Spirochaetota bacterium]
MKTRITEMLNVTYPFFGGTMMYISTASFVSAISEAGGVGILASAMFRSKESFRDAIKEIKDKTDKPFAVNINLFPMMQPIDNNEYLDVILEEGVKIVESSGHRAPDDIVARLKPEGVKLIHKCVGVRYARKAESTGVDMVTVVGFENGGATGTLDITTLCLVPTVVNGVNIPVIGGGGISSGAAIAAILGLGAEGVIIGTLLLCTEECPIHDNLKKTLLEAKETDTTLIMRPYGNTHRCLINDVVKKVQELEKENAPIEKVIPIIAGEENSKLINEGDLTKGFISCGQGIGQINKILPLKELFQQLAEETRSANNRLNDILR